MSEKTKKLEYTVPRGAPIKSVANFYNATKSLADMSGEVVVSSQRTADVERFGDTNPRTVLTIDYHDLYPFDETWQQKSREHRAGTVTALKMLSDAVVSQGKIHSELIEDPNNMATTVRVELIDMSLTMFSDVFTRNQLEMPSAVAQGIEVFSNEIGESIPLPSVASSSTRIAGAMAVSSSSARN